MAKPVITLEGLVLIVRGEDKWRFPDIQVAKDEQPDRRLEKGVLDMLDIDVETHQFIDAVNIPGKEASVLEIFIHAGARQKEVETSEGTEARWVDPRKLEEFLQTEELDKIERPQLSNFVRKLDSIPGGD